MRMNYSAIYIIRPTWVPCGCTKLEWGIYTYTLILQSTTQRISQQQLIIIYLQLTPFTSRPSYIPPPYSSGPIMFDSLIADFLCV